MPDKNIKERIYQLVEDSDDPTLLAIEEMLKRHQEISFWNKDEVEALNRDIEDSERQIENGDFITHEELKRRMQSW